MTQRKPRKTGYPQETRGSEMAAEIRKQANSLSDEERDELFKQGMQIIYGGPGSKEACPRH
jgi:hypothetical protein